MKALQLLKRFLQRRGKTAFISTVSEGGKLLDVGCGNDSPYVTKVQRPDVFYVGLDVGDYHQTAEPRGYADQYIVTSPEGFADEIGRFPDRFDAVISSHNLEHCLDPGEVLRLMLRSVKPGGRFFLAFPCEESVRFPHRGMTLNFYDDATHLTVPPYAGTLESIESAGFDIEFATKRYRPPLPFLAGLMLEPVSFLLKHNMPWRSTWALYGFESIIWARRRSPQIPAA